MESSSMKEGLRKRSKEPAKRWEPVLKEDWDDSLPYGGKVFIARRKKPDTWIVIFIEAVALIAALGLAYYAYFYYERLHYHVTRGYATFGFPEAQHVLGDKFFHGHGVEKDKHKAMEFYKLASDQGHPQSSYNLAVGHLKGVRKDLLKQGEARELIEIAAAKGVKEAVRVLNEYCVNANCDE